MYISKQERVQLDAQSQEAFGKKSQWRKLLDKGEYVPEQARTGNGQLVDVKRLQVLSLETIKLRMEKIIEEKKAALEAAKAAKEAAEAIESEKAKV
jgi:hypothetical protein